MSEGKLICIDKPSHLRSRFARGFKLSMTPIPDSPDDPQEILMKKYPSIIIEQPFANTIRMVLDFQHGHYENEHEDNARVKITCVMKDLIEMKKQKMIADWTLSQCSLEEVFMNLLHEPDIKYFKWNVLYHYGLINFVREIPSKPSGW